jgi:tyrosine-protein phosphatase non-receptor type 3
MIKKKTFSVTNDGNQPVLDSRSLQCRVNLLDGEEIVQDFNRKVPGHMVLDWVYNTLGILEREYFGLLYWSEKAQMQWLDPLKPLKKQITKMSCRFNFLVKFYAVDPATLKGLTRHLFFLQLKRDIAAGTLSLPDGSTPQILAYILQAELGDLNPLLQREKYINHFHLVPNQTPDIEERVEQEHEKLRGISRKQVIVKFLQRVKWLDGYGLRLFSVKGPKNAFMQLGLSPPGISVYYHGNKTVTYLWTQVVRVSYKSKKYTLSVIKDEEKPHPLVYDLDSYNATKNLWKLTIDLLNFYRSEAENRMVGREVDSLVDSLDTGSPHPTMNRRYPRGEFQGARLSPKRNSLPTSRRHAVSMSTASPDSSPQAPHLGDLLDSLESNERAIDVEFPPTPPSTSLSERDSSLLQPPSDNSLQSIPDGSGADSNSEHYKKLSAIQASLQGPSLRSSGRRRFRSHLLQYDSNQDLSEQPHHSYVLSVGSPNGPTG